MKYKVKYTIKIFKKNTKLCKNTIPGIYNFNNNLYNIYLINNILLKKIFKINFINVNFNNEINTMSLKINFKKFGNNIENIYFFNIKNNIKIFYECNFINLINKYLIYKVKNFLPRKIILNVFYLKKKIKDKDFNFKKIFVKNKILFFTN